MERYDVCFNVCRNFFLLEMCALIKRCLQLLDVMLFRGHYVPIDVAITA